MGFLSSRRALTCLQIAFVVSAAALAVAPAASAQRACGQQVIADWFDNGRIDKKYSVACFRDALARLPEDMEAYSSAPDDIRLAMQAALRGDDGPGGSASAGTEAAGSAGGATLFRSGEDTRTVGDLAERERTSRDAAADGDGAGSGTSAASRSSEQRSDAPSEGVLRDALEDLGPSEPNSFPVPLLILAIVAGLLIVLGASGLVGRRLQARRSRVRR